MPTAFVTGATGFVGLNLVRELIQEGFAVTALHRRTSNLKYLQDLDVQLAVGDVVERDSVLAAMPQGVDAVFHVAASVNFWRARNSEQTHINVSGTRNVAEAALAKGAKRFLLTSSIGAWGAQDGVTISEESASTALTDSVNYFRTKYLSELEVEKAIQKGLDATLLNPCNILGPYDLNNWGRVFPLLKAGKVPGVPPGSGDWCHVREVCKAHIAAVQRGRTGERYLLGGVHASHAEVMTEAARLLGVRVPRRLPAWLLRAVGAVGDAASRITGKEPLVTPEIARALNIRMRMQSHKAEQELGYRPVPLQEMMRDTYEFLLGEGLV